MKTIQELVTLHDTKLAAHNASLQYYDSERIPQYLSERLRDFFTKNRHYTQNWVAIVVDAVRNKELIESFVVSEADETNTTRSDAFNMIWDRNQGIAQADLVHEYVHAVGEGFVVAQKGEGNQAEFYANDPRCIEVVYSDVNPRLIVQAVKFWLDAQNVHKATVWELNETTVTEQTFTGRKSQGADAEAAKKETGLSYTPDGDPIPTGYARIPVFHFRRSLRNIKPEFYQVQSIQDSINKVFVSLGFSIENAADRARWAVTNADLAGFKAAGPGDVVAIPPASQYEQPVSVGEFGAADLDKLSNQLSLWKADTAAITSTPYHYFTNTGGAGLSGEALQAMESPLIAKIQRYIRLFSGEWEALAAFCLSVEGNVTTVGEVTCTYADPRTTLTISQATARELNVRAGIPLITQLRWEGHREDEIEKLLADRVREMPVELDEAQLQQAYDAMAQRNERIITPMLQEALNAISAAALNEIRASGIVEQAASQVAQQVSASA